MQKEERNRLRAHRETADAPVCDSSTEDNEKFILTNAAYYDITINESDFILLLHGDRSFLLF